MSVRKVAFSELNPIRFVPLDKVYPYNTKHFDDDWYRNLILSWQVKSKYEQKIQRNDRLYMQVFTNTPTAPILYLYRCDGTASIVNKTFTLAVSAYAGFRVWNINISDLINAVSDGTYYAVIEVSSIDGTDRWISEPMSVKDRHPGTVSLRYRHRHNKDLAVFEQTGAFFTFRVEAAIVEFEAETNRVTFEDQDGNLKLLSAIPFRAFKFIMGGNGKNIPDYAVSKGNHIFALSDIWIDGKKFIAADGAKFEKQSSDRYSLCTATIDIREAENNEGVIYKDGSFDLMTIPEDPFVIESYRIGTIVGYTIPGLGGDAIPIISYDFISNDFAYIADSTALDDWLDIQNSSVLPDAGLTGELSISADKIIYTPAEGETLSAGDFTLLTTYFSVIQTVPVGSGTDLSDTRLQMSGSGAPYAIILDGVMYLNGYLTGSLSTLQLRAAEDATHQFNVYHRNIINGIVISDGADAVFTNGTVTEVSGILPTSLIIFFITDCKSLPAFEFYEMLSLSRIGLQQAVITGNSILTDIGVFHEIGENSFSALKLIRINGNNLSVSSVNAFFNSIYLAIIDPTLGVVHFNVYNGTIDTRQTPPAAPTIASAPARAVLTGTPYNWTVITD